MFEFVDDMQDYVQFRLRTYNGPSTELTRMDAGRNASQGQGDDVDDEFHYGFYDFSFLLLFFCRFDLSDIVDCIESQKTSNPK